MLSWIITFANCLKIFERVQLAVDTERNATAFLKYIKKNAGIPFTAPEIPEVNFEDGLDLDSVNEADQEIEPDQHIKDEL
jgi:hypothetical protein